MDISRHWQDICHAIQEGVFLVDPAGTIVMANEGLARITGYSRDELTGQSCQVIGCGACDDERKACAGAWCPLFAGRSPGAKRCLLRRKDGSRVAVFKNQSLIRDARGQVVGAVESVLDLTEIDRLDRKVEALSRLLDRPDAFHGLVGKSAPMLRLYDILEKAARSEAPVLLLGESGTGKELAAQALHALGPRAKGPFVGVNCAALSEALLESELFGHAKGAFTGAVRARQGRFEAAHGGDLFLDEIGDTPLSTQVKLLRVLETGLMDRVGEDKPRRVDTRLITATNRDLPDCIARGRFREDFYFRIAVIPIALPPLRDRREDIPLLADHFLHLMAAKTGKPLTGLSPQAMDLFMRHPWPGNVRELKSAMEYAFVLAGSGLVRPEHLPATLTGGGAGPAIAAGSVLCAPRAPDGPATGAARIAGGGDAPGGETRSACSPCPPCASCTARDALSPARAAAQAEQGDAARLNPGGEGVVVSPAAPVVRPAAPRLDAGELAAAYPPGSPGSSGGSGGDSPGDSMDGPTNDSGDERATLVDALRRARGNKALAARLLGVNRLTVYNRMRKYGLRVDAVLTG